MQLFFSLVFISLLFSCTSIHTPEYELQFNSENETKIRILQISDFHSNDFGKNEEKLLKLIYQSQPDLIVLTGDIFDFEQKKLKPVKNVEPVNPFYGNILFRRNNVCISCIWVIRWIR